MSGWLKRLLDKPGKTGFVSWKRMQRRASIAYWSQFKEGDRVNVRVGMPLNYYREDVSDWFPGTIVECPDYGIMVELDKNPPWNGQVQYFLDYRRLGDMRRIEK